MNYWKTIVLSDTHIGSNHCRVGRLLKFLDENTAENWILNGDILDFTAMSRGRGVWNKKSTRAIKKIIDIADTANVIYILGNHEKMFRQFLPFNIGKIKVVASYIYTGLDNRKYYISHGDHIKVEKSVISTLAGGMLYHMLLHADSIYNHIRGEELEDEASILQFAKENLKAVEIRGINYRAKAIDMLPYECDCAIHGHIHIPSVTSNYMNSGDFSEGATALVEDFSGKWQILDYGKRK
jgi:UDP-2,3-diacylglucosamine pyrophosphatase LpxH